STSVGAWLRARTGWKSNMADTAASNQYSMTAVACTVSELYVDCIFPGGPRTVRMAVILPSVPRPCRTGRARHADPPWSPHHECPYRPARPVPPLDAVHRQPAIQVPTPHARWRQGHVLHVG